MEWVVLYLAGVAGVLVITNPEIMGVVWINRYIGPWVYEPTARYFAAGFWFITVPAFLIVTIAVMIFIPWVCGDDDENNYLG